MDFWGRLIGILVILGAPAGFFLWLKAFGGPDGETLQKRRMQGPFVPLGQDQIESDVRRREQQAPRGTGADS